MAIPPLPRGELRERCVGGSGLALSQGSENLFCKGPDSKHLRLLGPYGLCQLSCLMHCKTSYKQDVSEFVYNTLEHGCAPIKFYL